MKFIIHLTYARNSILSYSCFINFKHELVYETTFDCESKVVKYDQVPNYSYAYGVVNINDCLDVDDLVNIMNGTLSKNEQVKI